MLSVETDTKYSDDADDCDDVYLFFSASKEKKDELKACKKNVTELKTRLAQCEAVLQKHGMCGEMCRKFCSIF